MGNSMATTQQRKPMFFFITQHLPAFFHTPVLPTPKFLLKDVHIPGVGPKRRSRRSPYTMRSGKTQVSAPTNYKAGQFLVEGRIQRGQTARFCVEDKEFEIDANTWIIGNVEFGALARIKGNAMG